MTSANATAGTSEPAVPGGDITAAEVRVEVTEETARVLRQAADLVDPQPRLIVTWRGEVIGEIIPVRDAGGASEAVRSDHLARVHALRGSLAHLPTTSAELAREKAEEADWEDRA